MWPWEHAVVGYLAFTGLVHLLARRSPTGPEAITVVVASTLPDFIDKPLAWEFGVFQSGYAIGHSVFFAFPLAASVLAATRMRNRVDLGVAFGVGYLLHLAFDVIPDALREGSVSLAPVLWPLESTESSYPGGFTGTFAEYFGEYVSEIASGDPSGYLLAVTALAACCFLVWIYDGMPGVRGPLAALWSRF